MQSDRVALYYSSVGGMPKLEARNKYEILKNVYVQILLKRNESMTKKLSIMHESIPSLKLSTNSQSTAVYPFINP